ncbi:hypothetical protein lerEdw1_010758, partial [Lerista edwardsae]
MKASDLVFKRKQASFQRPFCRLADTEQLRTILGLVSRMEKLRVYFCDCPNGFSSYPGAFLDHKGSPTHCSINPWTDCSITCRRSPRLLTNGYYTFTEDSFLSDEDGNITLSPSLTSITYKEKSVKIFRRRKRPRRSLVQLFNMRASDSWLDSTACSDTESPCGEAAWLEGCSKVDASRYHDDEEEYFHEKSLDSSKTFPMKSDLCQMVMLSVCLIISLFA